MALHWPTFLLRTSSAIVFVIIMMAGLLWNAWSLTALVLIIQFLCLKEFFFLAEKISGLVFPRWMKWVLLIFSTSTLILIAWFSFQEKYWPPLSAIAVLPLIICLLLPFLLISSLSKTNFLLQGIWGITGLIYISLPAILLLIIYSIQWVFPLALILMIWSNDTLAYIVGSFIGKTPFSSISPKKTWEGTVGGVLLTIAGACLWSHFSSFKMMDAIALSLCATVAGTIGDLFESRLKRMADVKDSGNIMPGHGGALDRFDSLLVTVPFAFVYLYFTMS
jgi:phosphatidate cytidylyltransferase